MAGGALGRRECPLGHGSSRRVGEALELSQRLASFAFPQHRQRGASYRTGINVELAKMGERSSETRLSEAADQAARHFLLRRRHLLVRDRVNIRDAEVFLCSEHLLWIEADESGQVGTQVDNGRVCDDGRHAIVDSRCAKHEIAAKADAE